MKDLRPYVAAVLNDRNSVLGTAFFIRDDGHLITCHHVIRSADQGFKIKVFGESEPLPGKLVAFDAEADVAILRTERQDCPFLPVSSEWHAGQSVATHGFSIDTPISQFPDGVPAEFGIEGATTVVQSGGRRSDALTLRGAPVNRGLSGGPILCRETGSVVGILRYRLEAAEAAFATPIDTLAQIFSLAESIWTKAVPSFDWRHLPYTLNRTAQFPTLILSCPT